MKFRIQFDIGFIRPCYYRGGVANHKKDIKINCIKSKNKFDWTRFKFIKANLFVVTYVSTQLGEFWVWED